MLILKKFLLTILAFCCIHTIVNAQNNFQYDAEGRLIADHAEGIVSIVYNKLNKITQIIRSDTSHQPDMEFQYNADGNRLLKLVKPRTGEGLSPQWNWVHFYYEYDKGQIITIYKKHYEQLSENTFTEVLEIAEKYLTTTNIGYIQSQKIISSRSFTADVDALGNFNNIEELTPSSNIATSSSKNTIRGSISYALADQAGNIKSTVSDRKLYTEENTNVNTEVYAAQDFYPFGMGIGDRVYQNVAHRLGYNGMEKDNEIKGDGNSYNFDARMLDSRLGRWLTIDPLANTFAAFTPYNFSLNNPIYFNDPTGMAPQVCTDDSYIRTEAYPTKYNIDQEIVFDDSEVDVITPEMDVTDRIAVQLDINRHVVPVMRDQGPSVGVARPEAPPEPEYFLWPVLAVEGELHAGARVRLSTQLWKYVSVTGDVNAGDVSLAGGAIDIFDTDTRYINAVDNDNMKVSAGIKADASVPLKAGNKKFGVGGRWEWENQKRNGEWQEGNTVANVDLVIINEKKVDKRKEPKGPVDDVYLGERGRVRFNAGQYDNFVGLHLYGAVQVFFGVEATIQLGMRQIEWKKK